ncbi:MAG: MFS transporter [Caulobacteraceae bacterium]
MSDATAVDVTALIEDRKLGWFAIRVIVMSWLVTFFDGFDMNVIAFTSKYLQSAFTIDAKQLGNVFSIGLVGALLGGFLFGFIGDRFGRRPAIILATGAFSVLTVALAMVQSYPQLLVLRFFNGLALGGALPLVWALNVEFVPRRSRATVVTIIMLGYSFGVATAGPIARLLLPKFGWPSVFIFGGVASGVATLLLLAGLPESLRYLTTRANRQGAILDTIRKMNIPGAFDHATRFILADEDPAQKRRFHAAQLFEGKLKWLTPFLWAAYIASSMSTFFLTSWGPLVLEGLGFNANHAAWLSTVNSVCSATGGLLLMRFTDRYGPVCVAVLPLLAIPLLLTAGLAPVGLSVFIVFLVGIAVCLGGSHYGVTSIIPLFYPSSIRANGAGWGSAMGKIGSVLGPFIGGYVISSSLPVRNIYALLAVCPTIFASCILAIGWLERREARSLSLAEAPLLATARD